MAEKKSAARTGKNKEVAKNPPMGSREESFGADPGDVAIGGGNMALFGHRHQNSGVWPAAPVSVDQKTGYPQGWDGRSQSPSSKKN